MPSDAVRVFGPMISGYLAGDRGNTLLEWMEGKDWEKLFAFVAEVAKDYQLPKGTQPQKPAQPPLAAQPEEAATNWTPLAESIRREMLARFSDKLSMEEIASCAYAAASFAREQTAPTPLKFYLLPFRGQEGEPENPYMLDAKNRPIATMFWPEHSAEETREAELETYRLMCLIPELLNRHFAHGVPSEPTPSPKWLAAELQKENARLREALENPSVEMLIEGRKQCFADCNGPYMGPNIERIWKAMARAALSKEKAK